MLREVILFSCCVGLVSGCSTYSSWPQPIGYPESTQHKMRAVHHWNLLAEREAEQVFSGIEDKSTPIYVEPPAKDSSPFKKAFYDQLTAQLVKKGGLVLLEQRPDTVKLKYDIQVLNHKDTGYAPPPVGNPTEILVSMKVIKDERIITGNTNSYYIETSDKKNYTDYTPAVSAGIRLRVVNN